MRLDDVPLDSPSELYHENSKLHAGDRSLYEWIGFFTTSAHLRGIISRPLTRRKRFPTVALPREGRGRATSLDDVVRSRRSYARFSGGAVEIAPLARILELGDGVVCEREDDDGTAWLLRTAPSGGGLYPIDLYCAALRVRGLERGLYAYDPARHEVQLLLRRGDLADVVGAATYLGEPAIRAAAALFLVAVFARSRVKYGERAYRFTLLEAGHIAQNVLLACEAEGLAAVPVGGFLDDELNGLLGLDGVTEAVVYVVLLGTP